MPDQAAVLPRCRIERYGWCSSTSVLSGLTSKAVQKVLPYALLDNFRTPVQ